MAVWAMLVGMVTLINITMVGATISLAGNIPDSSFLAILSRYLGGKGSPPEAILYPQEAASRLESLRKRALVAAAVIAASALGLTAWALVDGWGALAMSAITTWLFAANVAFLDMPLRLWKRRAGRIRDEDVEEAWRKSRPAPPEAGDRPGGESESGIRGE